MSIDIENQDESKQETHADQAQSADPRDEYATVMKEQNEQKLRRAQKLAPLLLEVFKHNRRFYGLAGTEYVRDDRGAGGVKWKPKKPVTVMATPDTDFEQLMVDHLLGKNRLGLSPHLDDNTCTWCTPELDVYGVQGLPFIVERYLNQSGFIVEASKSGGAHPYLFLEEPVPVKDVARALRNIKQKMGMPQGESFPSGNEIKANADGRIDQNAGWLFMPYFDVYAPAAGSRVIHEGLIIEPEEFLELVKTRRHKWYHLSMVHTLMTGPSLDSVIKKGNPGPKAPDQPEEKPEPSDPDYIKKLLAQGPCCLEKMYEKDKGCGSGGRNNTGYQLGVLLRWKYPDGWQDMLRGLNKPNGFFHPPYEQGRQESTIKSLEKNAGLFYSCTKQPMESFCDKTECRKRKYGIGTSEETGKNAEPLIKGLVSLAELMKREVPPRQPVVNTVFLTQSLNMVFGERGAGKTWLLMKLALDVARGQRFMNVYDVPQPQRVLYVDGEMPLADIQERFRSLAGDSLPDKIDVLSSEILWLEKASKPQINREIDQGRFNALLDEMARADRRPQVIIFDNLSSLTSGMDENSNSDLDGFQSWLIDLRHGGYTVILVHHAGKNGTQRGASRREDLLDTVVRVAKVQEEGQEPEGARFTVDYTKHRSVVPKPYKLTVDVGPGAGGVLTLHANTADASGAEKEVLRAIHAAKPETQKRLAELMGKDKSVISKVCASLENKGLITRAHGLHVTEAGLVALGVPVQKEMEF